MPSLGPGELAIIAVIVVVLFGAGKLADVGGAIGKSVREFRHSVREDEEPKPPVDPGQATAPR